MVQRPLERFIFLSRWLMVPFYLGLVAALAALTAKFIQELLGFVPRVLELKDTDVILAVLTLLDLALAGSLVLMVIFSGYESFVSRLETVEPGERLGWMGTLDFGGLKLKLIASIVAIAGVHLLKSFMNIGSIPKADLAWLVGTYAVFVLSGVLLALMDYLTARAKAVEKGGRP
jgi:uncharacterized protein (TIGR00645 family)